MPTRIARELLASALDEMKRRGDRILNPEDLLLAVTNAGPLARRGVTPQTLRPHVERILCPPKTLGGAGGINDTTSRIIAQASERAFRRNGLPATADDVLFALIDETHGPQLAPAVLVDLGIDVDSMRMELAESS